MINANEAFFSKYKGEGKMGIIRIACVGAGLIGHSWVTLFAVKGLSVNLQDLNNSHYPTPKQQNHMKYTEFCPII